MYLLDTKAVSEIRKENSSNAEPKVLAWAKSVPTIYMYLSAITLLELEKGVLLVERRDSQQGKRLRTWLNNQVIPTFKGRILPIDAEVARSCASLNVPNPRPDRDALIAATALVNRLTLVTRNVSDFAGTNVSLINPWQQ